MIETEVDQSKRIIRHTARETVDRDDLVAAIEVTSAEATGCLWDFRDSQFAISLHVVKSPSYSKLFPDFNKSLQGKRTAYVVNSELHRLMIQTFAEEGGFTFVWRTFASIEDAEAWLQEAEFSV